MSKYPIPFSKGCTALITPFSSDLSVDYTSLGEIIDYNINSGISAILVLGTTGEASTLTDEERREIIRFAAQKNGVRVPLIVGCTSNNTEYAVSLARCAEKNGADAILAITPYYNKANQSGLIRHFKAIADATTKPVIIYNVPSRTGVDIPLSVYSKLSECENIVAVKEASGDISKVSAIRSSSSFSVYSGNDELTLPTYSLGGNGVISVLSNIMPKEVELLCSFAESCEYNQAKELHYRLYRIMKEIFSDVNPIPIKAACAEMGLCSDAVRLPLTQLSKEKRAELKETMKILSLI